MLLELERPAVEGTSHIEGGIAVFESAVAERQHDLALRHDTAVEIRNPVVGPSLTHQRPPSNNGARVSRSEEHTSELQSRFDLVCRLLLEKKKELTITP